MTGWVFLVALAGCWALGTGLRDQDGRLLENAIIVGAIANGVVAFEQQFVGSMPPTGMLGNQVFLGALLAASLTLLGPRLVSAPNRWGIPVALIALALGVVGQRLPAILAIAIALWMAWLGYRQRDRSLEGELVWRRSLMFGGLTVGAMVVGSLLTKLVGGVGVITQTASSTTSETFGQRFDAWGAALRSIPHHIPFGTGPNQFRAAAWAYFLPSFARTNGGNTFLDAHDFILELAVTVGVVGVTLFVAWVLLGIRREGPLLWFALILLLVELVEPLNLVITSLALLAIGAASIRPQKGSPGRSGGTENAVGQISAPRWVRRASLTMAILAIIPAVTLLVGDAAYRRGWSLEGAKQPGALSSATLADTLLAPWPDPATLVSNIHFDQYLNNDPSQLDAAVRWENTAISRDPTNELSYQFLTEIDIVGGRLGAAHHNAELAHKYASWWPAPMNALGVLATSAGQSKVAEMWLERSLAILPDQASLANVLFQLKEGCRAKPLKTLDVTRTPTGPVPNLHFTCPH